MKARFSVSSYSFHGLFNAGAFDLFGYFESVKYRYHLDTADIWNGMLRSYDEDYLKMLRLQMDERGLELVNLCCDGANIWCADAAEGAKFDATAADCLRAAETLGARSVRMDVGIKEKEFTDQQVEAVARKYDAYCAQAARFGARLGPENHWGASTNIDFMRRLFEAVKAPNFGLLLHAGNWAMSDATEEEKWGFDAEMAPKAFHIHLQYEVCERADTRIPPLMRAGYAGCWNAESHKSVNEYNNVAFQLAQIRRVVEPLVYGGKD